MAVWICHASKDEHGNLKGGQAGDQTGKEVCKREWYNRPWTDVIRFKDPVKAEKVAQDMEWAAENDNIGYDQNQRNTLLSEARKVNFNLSKIKVKCETDCSGLVSVCCMYAGIPESMLTYKGNCATTKTLKQWLLQTGEVEIFTSSSYTAKTDRLKRGDILLSYGHHVAVVVQTDSDSKKSAEEVAKEIVSGKGNWGTGTERRIKLADAGYNPSEVQQIVNRLMNDKKPVDNARLIWDYLSPRIENPYGVAGLMGNLQAESRLNPKNLQNSCEKKLGMNDDTYTHAVDVGSYKNFANDSCGYGIAQWTSSGRKAALLNYKKDRSIGDITMQLEFLWYELNNSYKNVLKVLKSAKSVAEASDYVLTKFERPKDQSEDVKKYRANLGIEIYKQFIR